jgi:hypothetical protein
MRHEIEQKGGCEIDAAEREIIAAALRVRSGIQAGQARRYLFMPAAPSALFERPDTAHPDPGS